MNHARHLGTPYTSHHHITQNRNHRPRASGAAASPDRCLGGVGETHGHTPVKLRLFRLVGFMGQKIPRNELHGTHKPHRTAHQGEGTKPGLPVVVLSFRDNIVLL